MRHVPSASVPVLFMILSHAQLVLAQDQHCGAQSQRGDICLCEIAELHPTQASVGMTEVGIKAGKLTAKIGRSETDYLAYVLKHCKEEPVTIGPGGIFYITDHHHLARALYNIGLAKTYCKITDNLSDAKLDAFWKQLEANKEVYLKDQNGNPITPQDLPASVNELHNDPFRSLAGAVRKCGAFAKDKESCGAQKDQERFRGEDFLEFQWAEYLRAHWAQTGIAVEDIDANFERAKLAARQLAAQKDATKLPGYVPGYTAETACD